jgi:hypothetical protein
MAKKKLLTISTNKKQSSADGKSSSERLRGKLDINTDRYKDYAKVHNGLGKAMDAEETDNDYDDKKYDASTSN